MNACWASVNFDDFIAFRSSQPGKLARNFPVQNEGLFRAWISVGREPCGAGGRKSSQHCSCERRSVSSATFLAHVEHILPRAPRGEWCRAFYDEDERADLKNRLGNLCLLHRDDNNRASNLEWRVKRDIYRKSGPAYAGAHEVAMEEHWTPDLVKSRTRQMADGIIKLLAI